MTGNYDFFSLSVNGKEHIRLTDNKSDDGYISWSPDGSELAFMSDRDGNYEIYKMDYDGGNPVKLTNDDAADTQPSWSPF